ncbi:SCO family protein [Litorivicinus lipolyticus]|uniref:SCO family protein n=1 Tax=Litorivicinus lipolyticus TaxID=418701 RepID=UPI003B5A0E52
MPRTLMWLLAGVLALGLGVIGSQWLPDPKNARELRLTSMDGAPFDSAAALAGKPYVVTFGYTFCPDICPTTLAYLAQVLDAQQAATGQRTQSVFVSVDPARDTPERLTQYVAYFDPTTIALTGSEAELKAAAQTFSVYFAKVDAVNGEDYLVDHSAGLLVLDADHQLIGLIRDGDALDDALALLAKASP